MNYIFEYHCRRCGELFESNLETGSEIIAKDTIAYYDKPDLLRAIHPGVTGIAAHIVHNCGDGYGIADIAGYIKVGKDG